MSESSFLPSWTGIVLWFVSLAQNYFVFVCSATSSFVIIASVVIVNAVRLQF